MKKQLLLFVMLLTVGLSCVWGQVKIKDGTVTGSAALPGNNAILELESNAKGLLLPRVALSSTSSASPLSALVAGMVVYNTATAGAGNTAVSPGYYYSDGASWIRLAAAGAVPLSSLVAAVSTNNINNANFAQVWDWSTATTQTPLTLTGNALTTGSLLSLSSSSTGITGTAGLLRVANTGATTGGVLASFRGNNADSGLNIMNNGSVGVGTNTPNATALFEMVSTSKGFLIPRLTTAQRNAIGGPAIGLEIFNTDINCLEFWNAVEWVSMCGGSANGTASPDCYSRKLYGVYQVGTPATGNNYVVIPVTVAQAGKWNAVTSAGNGIQFSGNGTFAAPGTDSIRLYATAGAIPVANGVFTYNLTLGSNTCSFTIDYNSLPGCTTPGPALTSTTVCTILQGSSKSFAVSGGTANTTSLTYSITPTMGVSAPTGLIAFGSTPAITFSNIGNYTITFTAKNSSSTCNEASIATTQGFQVVSGPPAATPTHCTSGRFGPSVFSSNQYTTSIGGVSVTTTWAKNGGAANGSTAYTYCGFAAPPASQFRSASSAVSGGITTNTFTYNYPVSNIQLITGLDNSGSIVVTAKNGTADVTGQLILTPLNSTCNGSSPAFTQLSCNSFTAAGNNNVAGGFVIGGTYFTEFTISSTSTTSANAGDAPFDLSYCQAVTNACSTPTAASVTYSAKKQNLGNSITATATATGYTTAAWAITTISGTYTGALSGTGSSAVFSSSAVCAIQVQYTFTNNGNGTCLGTAVAKTDTLVFANSAPPVLQNSCAEILSYPANININGTSITVTRTVSGGTTLSGTQTYDGCTVSMPSGSRVLTSSQSDSYTFSKPVYNIRVLAGSFEPSQGETLVITATYAGTPVALNLTAWGPQCNGYLLVNGNIISGFSNNGQTGYVTIGGDRPIDAITFKRVATSNAGTLEYTMSFCDASLGEGCTPPSLQVNYNVSTKKAVLGGSITGTANVSGHTAFGWTATAIRGKYTGIASGSGTTALISSDSLCAVRVVFTATNVGSGCTTQTTTKIDTLVFANNAPAVTQTPCTEQIAYPANITISGMPVTITRLYGTGTTTSMVETYSGCTVSMPSGSRKQAYDNYDLFTFSKPLYNVRLLVGSLEPSQNETLEVTATYGGTMVQLNLLSWPQHCTGNIVINGNVIKGVSNNGQTGYVTLSGDRPFDTITFRRVGDNGGGTLEYTMSFCNAQTGESVF